MLRTNMDGLNWQQYASLQWKQPHALHRTFELLAGDAPVGQLEFRSAFGSRAAARMGGVVWTYKRMGFFSTKVTARLENTPEDAAVFEPSFTGSKGVLSMRNGEQLRLKSVNFWATEWILSDSADRELLRFHNKGILHHGAAVEISELGRSRNDLPLLVSLTWYVLVLYMEDASTAT